MPTQEPQSIAGTFQRRKGTSESQVLQVGEAASGPSRPELGREDVPDDEPDRSGAQTRIRKVVWRDKESAIGPKGT